jgi:hypothetical protein
LQQDWDWEIPAYPAHPAHPAHSPTLLLMISFCFLTSRKHWGNAGWFCRHPHRCCLGMQVDSADSLIAAVSECRLILQTPSSLLSRNAGWFCRHPHRCCLGMQVYSADTLIAAVSEWRLILQTPSSLLSRNAGWFCRHPHLCCLGMQVDSADTLIVAVSESFCRLSCDLYRAAVDQLPYWCEKCKVNGGDYVE